MVASAGEFALESASSWLKALLCMLKYMPVFFFSSFYIVYIILNAVLTQYQIAGCRLLLLSLPPLSAFSLSLSLSLSINRYKSWSLDWS
jgi:hypothetical protein